jgi:hypothetical protein
MANFIGIGNIEILFGEQHLFYCLLILINT